VRLSLGLSEPLAETVAASAAAAVVCPVISTLDMAVVPPVVVLVPVPAVRSMWPTFVQPRFVYM
jgi:hypothetical protein